MAINNRIILSTKARTLQNLKTLLKKSKIEDLLIITYSFWKNNEEEVLDKIRGKFKDNLIIIRSSAINEDTENESMAGQFKSILNVHPKNKEEVKEAINKVFQSYKEKKTSSSFNQILIQLQTKDIKISGVIFTRGLMHNSPYYIINYDDATGSSESVTSGLEGKIIKILKYEKIKNIPKKFKRIIIAIKEIERKIPKKGLDIEFAINKKEEVIIFQVRPMVIKKEVEEDKMVKKRIKRLEKEYEQLSKKSRHIKEGGKIFADMPDWNPAEILGDNPGYLDFSLYDYIITKSAWHKARVLQGYDAGPPSRLVILFANKPYVDVENTFSSFIPNGLSKELREKIICFYIDKLKKYPELQDKVEFEILYTCYDFCFNERAKELLDSGFSQLEIEKLKKALIDLTNNLILNSKNTIKKDLRDLEDMKKKREKKKLRDLDEPITSLLTCSKSLLDDCKENGTVQFSKLARLAFIGKILLKSLVNKEIIDKKTYDQFMESIRTVSTEFEEDFELMKRNKMPKDIFIKKYYHLRPGTYDITSKRYESNLSLLKAGGVSTSTKKTSKIFKLDKNAERKIDLLLRDSKLNFNCKELFNFIKASIEAREFSKFEFTKNLSDAMELIAIAGEEMGFNRKELSLLGLEDLFVSGRVNKNKLTQNWKEKIIIRSRERQINSKIELPPTIFSKEDFRIIKYYTPRPNFITQKKIIATLSKLNKESLENSKIEGKVIMLENGDPGYDWIFTRNPAGLVTKYGGVASHMAIRCAEFGIPAAIGCGILYDQLEDHLKITLDCQLKRIIPMEVK